MKLRKNVLVIGGGNEGLDLFEKIDKLGLGIININSKENHRESFLPYLKHFEIADYQNIRATLALAKKLHITHPFKAVISFSENGLLSAAAIGDEMGFRGNSFETTKLLKDKLKMRKHLEAHNISPIVFASGKCRTDIEKFINRAGYPIIVKPVDGMKSKKVYKLCYERDLDTLTADGFFQELDHFIMEEYLDGQEVSVECFSFCGQHLLVAVTEKITLDNHVEIAHAIPSDLGSDIQNKIRELVFLFLDSVGLKEGPSHTEIKLTKSGVKIIESHNRTGGDRINELIRNVYGIDLKKITVQWYADMIRPFSVLPKPRMAHAIRFFSPQPGRIKKYQRIKDKKYIKEYSLKVFVGDEIGAIYSSDDRVGHVICEGSTPQEALQRCLQVEVEIGFEYV